MRPRGAEAADRLVVVILIAVVGLVGVATLAGAAGDSVPDYDSILDMDSAMYSEECPNGDSWTEDCNTCHCSEGKTFCTLMSCVDWPADHPLLEMLRTIAPAA